MSHKPDSAPGGPSSRRARQPLSGTILRTSAANIALPLSAILTGPLLARTLGPADRGALAAVLTPLLLGTLLGTFGVPEAVVYAVARRIAPLKDIARAGLCTGLVSGLVAGGVIFILAPTLLRKSPEHIALLRWLALTVPIATSMTVVRSLSQGLGRFDLINSERWLSVLTRVPLLFGLAFAGALTVGSAAWVTQVTGLAAMMVLWLALREPPAPTPRPERLGRQLISYGGRAWAGTIAGILVLRLDQAILAPLVGPAELGYYAVAVSLAEVPTTLHVALRDVLFSAATDRDDPQLIARGTRVLLLITTAVAAAGVLASPPVLPLVFGRDFEPAVAMAQILFAAGTFGGIAIMLGVGLLSVGRPGARSTAQIAGLAANVSLLLALVEPHGAIGAAWATLGGYLMTALISLVQFRRATGLGTRECLVPTRDDLRDVHRLGRRLLRRPARSE